MNQVWLEVRWLGLLDKNNFAGRRIPKLQLMFIYCIKMSQVTVLVLLKHLCSYGDY